MNTGAYLAKLAEICPSFDIHLRAELITTWSIRPLECFELKRLINAWGEEPNNRRTPEERRRELRERVMAYMRGVRVPAALRAEMVQ